MEGDKKISKKRSKKKVSKKKTSKKTSKKSEPKKYVEYKKIKFDVFISYINHKKEVFGAIKYNSEPIIAEMPKDTEKEAFLGLVRAQYTEKLGEGYLPHPYEKTKKIYGIKKLVIIKEI